MSACFHQEEIAQRKAELEARRALKRKVSAQADHILHNCSHSGTDFDGDCGSLQLQAVSPGRVGRTGEC